MHHCSSPDSDCLQTEIVDQLGRTGDLKDSLTSYNDHPEQVRNKVRNIRLQKEHQAYGKIRVEKKFGKSSTSYNGYTEYRRGKAIYVGRPHDDKLCTLDHCENIMDPVIFTPRLKLTLITSAPRGSRELEWLHEIRSDEKATWWSTPGRSTCLEDTERYINDILPTEEEEDGVPKTYRVTYAVHKLMDPTNDAIPSAPQSDRGTKLIGLVILHSLDADSIQLPENLTIPASAASTTLTVELSSMFLPVSRGRAYAPEAVNTVFEACRVAPSFWLPFKKVYVRAFVNHVNWASRRAASRTPMEEKGIFEYTGPPVFLDGEWTTWSRPHIFGMYLLGDDERFPKAKL
ncbi:MAG: hypothetical protein Q9168_002669 [Polycauliona sp. 1 TL-2023]